MVHKRCFIANCSSSIDKENGGVCMFGLPKGKVSVWQEKLSHKPGLTQHSRLCHRHFAEEDIIKGYEIQGEFHPLKQWHLKKDVVLTLNLGLTYTHFCIYTWHCLNPSYSTRNRKWKQSSTTIRKCLYKLCC